MGGGMRDRLVGAVETEGCDLETIDMTCGPAIRPSATSWRV
jgi:hypothetical protein